MFEKHPHHIAGEALVDFCNFLSAVSKRDKKTRDQTIIKIMEELGELSQAHLIASGASGTGYRSGTASQQDVIEETIDVILCAVSLLPRIDATDDDIERICDQKVAKWLKVTSVPGDGGKL